MTKAYFLSDLHLRNSEEKKAQILLRFLHSNAGDGDLFLLGDIFDLWLGDHKYFQEKFSPIIKAIQQWLQKGGRVYYFEGNHDLHLKKFWQQELGVEVYTEPTYFNLGLLKVRVEHGDQMDPEDRGYLFLRWFLRTPILRSLIYHLPGTWVAAIGENASSQSRTYTTSRRDENRQLRVMHQHAEKMVEQTPFDALVAGHVHQRDEYRFCSKSGAPVVSYNLGVWTDQEMPLLQLYGASWKWENLSK